MVCPIAPDYACIRRHPSHCIHRPLPQGCTVSDIPTWLFGQGPPAFAHSAWTHHNCALAINKNLTARCPTTAANAVYPWRAWRLPDQRQDAKHEALRECCIRGRPTWGYRILIRRLAELRILQAVSGMPGSVAGWLPGPLQTRLRQSRQGAGGSRFAWNVFVM